MNKLLRACEDLVCDRSIRNEKTNGLQLLSGQ